MRFLYAFIIATFVAACGGGHDVTPVTVPFTPIAVDVASSIRDFRTAVVRNRPSWESLWAEHTATRTSPPPAPAVDFSKEMVVAVFLGGRGGCSDVRIVDVTQSAEVITVRYKEAIPAPGDICIQSLTFPSSIATIPASTASVQFVGS